MTSTTGLREMLEPKALEAALDAGEVAFATAYNNAPMGSGVAIAEEYGWQAAIKAGISAYLSASMAGPVPEGTYTPTIIRNESAGFYEFVTEDVPALYGGMMAANIERIGRLNGGDLIGFRIYDTAAPASPTQRWYFEGPLDGESGLALNKAVADDLAKRGARIFALVPSASPAPALPEAKPVASPAEGEAGQFPKIDIDQLMMVAMRNHFSAKLLDQLTYEKRSEFVPQASITMPTFAMHEVGRDLIEAGWNLRSPDREAATREAVTTKAAREVLFFASYCGGDNPACSPAKPCPTCLGMSNVYSIPPNTPITYIRELAPEWNGVEDPALSVAAVYLDGMADNAKNHGYVDATSYHNAYEQGVRESAAALRALAQQAKPQQEKI